MTPSLPMDQIQAVAQQHVDAVLLGRVMASQKKTSEYEFGALASVLLTVPVHCLAQDDPRCPSQAFTNGSKIVLNAEFVRWCIAQDEGFLGMANTVLWVLLHEAMHILNGHVMGRALKVAKEAGLSPSEAQGLLDVSVNSRLASDFPDVTPSPKLLSASLGTHIGSVVRMSNLTEEQIIHWYVRDPLGFCQSAGISLDQLHSATSHVEPQPSEDEKRSAQLVRAQILMAERTKRQQGGGGVGWKSSACHAPIEAEFAIPTPARARFPLDLPRAIDMSGAPSMGASEDTPHDLWYCDVSGTGFSAPPFMEGWAPQPRGQPTILALVDNSSSMDGDEVRAALGDLWAISRRGGRRELQVILQLFDVGLAGDPIILNDVSRKRLRLKGRRHTDMQLALQDASHRFSGDIASGRIRMALIFSDLICAPPVKPTRWPSSTIIVCPNGGYNAAFALNVSEWARVLEAMPIAGPHGGFAS